MKYWEFLIQKEGDINWLPLETHQVQILEGRYCVVAHTDRTNTPTDIQVSQLGTTDLSPTKRVRTGISQTDANGLVIVVPYMNFQPGRWELTCRHCKPIDDLDDWQYSLQIQVLSPTEVNRSSDWPSDWPSDWLTAANAKKAVDETLYTSSDTKKEAYEISLRQQAFLAQDDQPITISGQVRSLSNLSVDRSKSQLWLRLREPNTAQVLIEAYRLVNLARLPADFEITFQLPTCLPSRIILGEVYLHSASPKTKTSGTRLSTIAFTITAGIAQLLDDIVNRESNSADLAKCDDKVSMSQPQKNADYADDIYAQKDRLPLVALPLSVDCHNVPPAVGVILPTHSDYLAYTNLPDWLDLTSLLPSNLLLVSDSPKSHSQQDDYSTEPELLDTVAVDLDKTEPNSDRAVSSNELTLSRSDTLGGSDDVSLLSSANVLSTTLVSSDKLIDGAESLSTAPDTVDSKQTQTRLTAKVAFKSLKLKDRFMRRLSDLTYDGINQSAQSTELYTAGTSLESSQMSPQVIEQSDTSADS